MAKVDNLENVTVEVIDERQFTRDNPNFNAKTSGIIANMPEGERRAMYALRAQKAAKTRKENVKYKHAMKRSLQALLDGDFGVCEDGETISGADILAIGLFDRARSDNKALELVLKTTGDLKESVEVTAPSYEQFLEGLEKKW